MDCSGQGKTAIRDFILDMSPNKRCVIQGVINATGPFTDGLRKMDEPTSPDIVSPASGVHITLPNYYAPEKMGLIDPATSDGRVIFFLPWQGVTIAGTTDSPAEVTQHPIPREDEIDWILSEVKNYLSPDIRVRRGDVLSAWSGLRPLVKDPGAKNTESLVRNHMINVSKSGLLTIAGGKWTTYRAMAEETVDRSIKEYGLEAQVKRACVTEKIQLVGSHGWTKMMFVKLIQQFGLEVRSFNPFDFERLLKNSRLESRSMSRNISRILMVIVRGPSVRWLNLPDYGGLSTVLESIPYILTSTQRLSGRVGESTLRRPLM